MSETRRRLKAELALRGVTLRAVADKAGVRYDQASKTLTGTRPDRSDVIARLASALVQLSWKGPER